MMRCLLRHPGTPRHECDFTGVQIDDPRLAEVLDPRAPLLVLYDQLLHGEGPVWEPGRGRLIFSDIPGRRVLAWYPDGRVEVAIDAVPFVNGNALDTSRSIGGPTHDVVVFDVARGGQLSNRRFFCHTEHGVPDGFLVDSRGWLWTTAGDGLHVYAADQTKLGFVPTPMTASNCAVGGPDGTRLFITADSHLYAIDLRQTST